MPIPDLTSRTEEGFHDLVFATTAVRADSGGNYSIDLAAKHSGALVGFTLIVRGGMRPGFDAAKGDFDRSAFYPKGITFASTGEASNQLVHFLPAIYGLPVNAKRMRSQVEVTAVALGGDPRRLATEEVRFKVFHDDDGSRGEYAEIFVNVNLPKSEVELREKDQDYRENLVKALAETVTHALPSRP